ncbi:hypothetical protein FEP99_02847 [Burkholderia pseudomultivorans]|nr:hypothetical protein [Burkholderia pseudomultivorans]
MTVLFVELRPVDSEPIPVEVEVESDAMELLADDRPVDVEVDSEVTVLLVELSPVDSDAISPLDDDTVVDSESSVELVAKSCEPLIASVLFAVICPAATFVTWRSAP